MTSCLASDHEVDGMGSVGGLRSRHAHLLASRGYVAEPYGAIECIFRPSRSAFCAERVAGYTRLTVDTVHRGDADSIAQLLAAGLDPNSQNAFGMTLLHRACRQPNPRIVRLLIDHGACVRCADDSGKTPMHDLCWMGNVNKDSMLEIAHMLLSVDESILRAQDRLGFTPLDYVREDQTPQWAAFLDAHKELFWSPRNAPGRTPAEWAEILWPPRISAAPLPCLAGSASRPAPGVHFACAGALPPSHASASVAPLKASPSDAQPGSKLGSGLAASSASLKR